MLLESGDGKGAQLVAGQPVQGLALLQVAGNFAPRSGKPCGQGFTPNHKFKTSCTMHDVQTLEVITIQRKVVWVLPECNLLRLKKSAGEFSSSWCDSVKQT